MTAAIPLVWRALVAELNGGRIPDGEPGIRDVDAPCEGFRPAGAPWEYAAGTGSCDTDGHYICKECIEISLRELRRRQDQCQDCGAPLGVRFPFGGGYCTADCDLPAVPAVAAS